MIYLQFTGTPTVTDGGNLKLNGNLAASATDTLTLISDGVNWYEVGRSNAGGDVTVIGTLYQHVASVSSATDVTLPAGNIFSVTGTTPINKFLPPTITGRVIHVRLNATITIQDASVAAGNIGLRGSTNFYALSGDMITLYSDGTNWVEISRRTIEYHGTSAIASSATIAIPAFGVVFHVTGTTNITNGITVNPWDFGRQITLIFDSTPTVTDTGTSKLNGNFVATADDTLTLVCDGSNWFEVARSVN